MLLTVASISAADTNHDLRSLVPVSRDLVREFASEFQGISGEYLEFISRFGTGSTESGFHIYSPIPARKIADHPSFQIYNGEVASRIFASRPSPDVIPEDAVMIADVGASWRYCLCPSKGAAIFCLEMLGPEFVKCADGFYSFVLQEILTDV